MAAVALAINPDIGRQDLGSLRVFSLSSGSNPQGISGTTLDWGFAQWAQPMASLMIDANVGIADYQCRQILGEKAYFRFDTAMPVRIATDDRERLHELMRLARDADISEAPGCAPFAIDILVASAPELRARALLPEIDVAAFANGVERRLEGGLMARLLGRARSLLWRMTRE